MARIHQSKTGKSKRRGSVAGSKGSRGPRRHSAGDESRDNGLWLYGLHAVESALGNPDRRIVRLLATPEAAEKLAAKGLSRDRLSLIEPADRSAIDTILGPDKVHQGLALKTNPLPAMDIQDALVGLDADDPALVVALDHVTDPHNVGAILRSASAFGARAVLTTKHNAPEETGTLAKSASGALENLPIVKVTNLGRTIKECQDLGFWVVGLDASGSEDLDLMDLPKRCVLVLGAEGEGLRPGIQGVCDFMAKLPMTGQMESLNVSNAAAVSMFEWMRQQRGL